MRLAAALFCLIACLAASGAEAKKVALVIGNDAYRNLAPLKKAVANAEAYAGLLRNNKGYEVALHRNVGRDEMDEAVAAFVTVIEPGDTAIFVYSGHGWSDGKVNYVIGVDAPGTGSEAFLSRVSLSLQNGATGVLDEIEARGAVVRVAIIDACRNNPFKPPTQGKSFGMTRGLSRMIEASGTFIIQSAAVGQEALDGLSAADPHANGVFTRVFVPLIEADMTLEAAMNVAQERVYELARTAVPQPHIQEPTYYDGIRGSVCLAETCVESAPPPPQAEGHENQAGGEKFLFDALLGSSSIAMHKAFLKEYPHSAFAPLVIARLTELQDDIDNNSELKDSNSPLTADLHTQASTFVREVLESWSKPNAEALQELKHFYSDNIEFYGNSYEFSRLYGEKEKFAIAWPEREYQIKSGSLKIKCEVASLTCEASLIVVWDATNKTRASRGEAEFALSLAMSDNEFRITAEKGRVISRN